MQICLIDDEPIVLQTLSAFITDLGHSVICSGSKGDLDAMPVESAVDLVITDLRLPGLNGLRLIRRVHQLFPGTPIVVISGHRADLLSMRDAVENDVYAFLHKPFSLNELEFLLMRLVKERAGGKNSGSPDSIDKQEWETRSDGGG